MVYPRAFGQNARVAFDAAITPLVRERWAGKDIIATYQTYDDADVPSQVVELNRLYVNGIIVGGNSYTLGHATQDQWDAALPFDPEAPQTVPLAPDVAAAMIAIRKLWVDSWHVIEQRGTVAEAVALAGFWQALTGQK